MYKGSDLRSPYLLPDADDGPMVPVHPRVSARRGEGLRTCMFELCATKLQPEDLENKGDRSPEPVRLGESCIDIV